MKYKQKFIQIGNSLGVIIPKDLLDSLGYKKDQDIYLENVNSRLVLDAQDSTSVSPEFLRIAEGVANKYADAFQELASK